MSTLMLASASGPKIAAATPGLSATLRKRDLGLVLGIGDAGDDLVLHDVLLVADQGAGLRRRRVVEGRAHVGRHAVHHGELDGAHLQHLGPERGHLQHLLEGDPVEAAGLAHDARVGGVDAVDVRVDVAALGLERRGERDRARVRAAAAERGDASGRAMHPLEARDHGDLAALGEAVEDRGAVDVGDARGAVRLGRAGSAPASPARSGRAARGPGARWREARPSPARRRRPPRRTRAGRGSAPASLHQATSSLVLPAMAETTTATS